MKNSTSIQDAIWSQFGASLETLENAIKMCPENLWDSKLDFWYQAYHCLFWTDYYLSVDSNSFQPPAPFTLSEFDPTGIKPERTYAKVELLNYLEHCQHRAKQLITGFSLEQLNDRWINEYKNFSMLEILIYNIRHIQHHAAQLNLLLRQTVDDSPTWVSQVKD